MPRKKSTIKIGDKQSLESLMQEAYFDACSLSKEAQNNINKIKRATTPETVDDYTKIAREVTNALKVKESGVKLKMEILKLQNEIIKAGHPIEGDVVAGNTNVSATKPDFKDFKQIRDIVNNNKNKI